MKSCPRCGALNHHSRTACWNCLAPLGDIDTRWPREEPAESGVHAEEVLQPVFAESVQNAPYFSSEQVAMRQHDPAESPDHHTLFVATPVVQAERRGGNWLLIAAITLSIVLLLALLLWYVTLHAAPNPEQPAVMLRRYLTAVSLGDVIAQRQLSTSASRQVVLPRWLHVQQGRIIGAPQWRRNAALYPVELDYLTVTGATTPEVRKRVQVSVLLVLETAGWRVDQRQFVQVILTATSRGSSG